VVVYFDFQEQAEKLLGASFLEMLSADVLRAVQAISGPVRGYGMRVRAACAVGRLNRFNCAIYVVCYQ